MKKTTAVFITLIVALTALICICSLSRTVGDSICYEKAATLLEQHDYENAAEEFARLGVYRDSEVLCKYARLRASFDEGSDSSIYRAYSLIKNIDREYTGTRFVSDISGDIAFISGLYRTLGENMAAKPEL